MAKKTPAQLEERAYHIWERAGRPHGQALEHWLQAQVEAESAAAGTAPAEKPKGRTRKAARSTPGTSDGNAAGTRSKAAGAKAEPAKTKPKKVAKSAGPARKTGTRKPSAPGP